MKIYINDIPVKITDKAAEEKTFDIVISKSDEVITIGKLKGKILIRNKGKESIDDLLKIMTKKRHDRIKKIRIQVKDKAKVIKYLMSKFDIIKAAGGIVYKGDDILWIFRKGKWDLPKGKLEKGESKKEGAVREVEEETCVKVKIEKRLGATWHSYLSNGKYVLKRTYWYTMTSKDDSKMKPQKKEGITKVRWMNKGEIEIAMTHTYATIERIVNKYLDIS